MADQRILGTTGNDSLNGGTGNDTLYGYAGNDTMYGGKGHDILDGDDGTDELYGESGSDTLYGGAGNDVIDGGNDNDMIRGDEGNDTLTGGSGNDRFVYRNSDGHDVIEDYGKGNDTLNLVGVNIARTAFANSDRDIVFTVGTGSVTLKEAATKTITIEDDRGNYTVSANKISLATNFTGTLNLENYLSTVTTVETSTTAARAVNIYGNGLANKITGSKSDDHLYGSVGNDTLIGRDGNDSLYGGTGNDSITGDDGSDYLLGDAGGDSLSGGKGTDTLHGGTGNDTLNGGDGNDSIYGEDGNDSLDGSYGNDLLSGGSGNDTLKGGRDNDTLYGGAGNDTLYGYTDNDYLYGDAGNDYLNGEEGSDYLYGGAGNDTLDGGSSGNDTFAYAESTGNDIVMRYTSGYDTLHITKGAIGKTVLDGSNLIFTVGKGTVNLGRVGRNGVTIKAANGGLYTMTSTDLTAKSNFTGTLNAANYLSTVTTINGSTASKAVQLYGNNGANTVSGGSGNDKLYGQAGNDKLAGNKGNDYLYGGAGNDTLTGGAGKDTFAYAANTGKDIVSDYVAGQDTLYITSGAVSKVALANKNKDMVFTVGKGTVTLKNAGAKKITLKDSRGIYAMTKSTLTLSSNFKGTLDARKYFATTTTVNGSAATKAANLYGNAKANVLRAGKGGGVLRGYAGNDTLYGGAGKDTFQYDSGKDTVYNYQAGKDVIKFASTKLKSGKVSGSNVVLTLANGGTITVRSAAGKKISYVDSTGKTKTATYKAAASAKSSQGASAWYADAAAPMAGTSEAQLSSLVSTTRADNLGTLQGTGLDPANTTGNGLVAANTGTAANPLTKK